MRSRVLKSCYGSYRTPPASLPAALLCMHMDFMQNSTCDQSLVVSGRAHSTRTATAPAARRRRGRGWRRARRGATAASRGLACQQRAGDGRRAHRVGGVVQDPLRHRVLQCADLLVALKLGRRLVAEVRAQQRHVRKRRQVDVLVLVRKAVRRRSEPPRAVAPQVSETVQVDERPGARRLPLAARSERRQARNGVLDGLVGHRLPGEHSSGRHECC